MKDITLKILKYFVLSIAALITILPLLVVFIGSFKTNQELMSSSVLAAPDSWFNLDNYRTAFVEGKMLLGFKNTAIILVASLFATVMLGTMTAYILSRFRFRFRNSIKMLFLIASLIPSITMQMSTFQIIVGIGLYDTIWSTILLFAGTDIISIYIFLQFLNGIPISIDQAAIMDGASFPQIFFKVIFPLLKPAITTVVIIKGVAFYNEFYTPYLYMKSQNLQVISTAMYRFKGPFNTQWEVICAGIIITMVPTLVAFLLLQKKIYSGLTQGSVKE